MSSTPPEDSESCPATQAMETQFEEGEEPYNPSLERPQTWAQIVFKNGREPQELPLNADRGGAVPKDEYRIGRHASNLVQVQDPRVSTRHCCISRTEIEIVPGSNLSQFQVTLEDLSTNGTWVNGQRLKKNESRLLNSGDAVALVNPNLCQDAKDVHGLQFYFYLVTPCVEVETAGSAGHLDRAEGALQIRGSINASGNRIETFYDISGKKLGSGGYAEVYQATDRKSGRQCAVKIMTKQKLHFLGTTVDAVQREAEVMSQLEHPSVLRLYDVFTSPVAVFLVVELVEGGDLLERLLNAADPYTEDRARILLRNLIEAIRYLHKQNVVHRDLKPENILMLSKESDVDIKIADFGMAKKFSTTGGLKTFCGTANYVAPEVLQRMDSEQREGSYSEAADMWSAGVIMYIVLVREQPFCEANDQLYDNIKAGNFIQWNAKYTKLTDAAKNLITSLLTVHPEDRLSADAALQHVWFADPTASARWTGVPAGVTGSRLPSAAGPSESPLDAPCATSPQVSSYMPASKRVKHH